MVQKSKDGSFHFKIKGWESWLDMSHKTMALCTMHHTHTHYTPILMLCISVTVVVKEKLWFKLECRQERCL